MKTVINFTLLSLRKGARLNNDVEQGTRSVYAQRDGTSLLVLALLAALSCTQSAALALEWDPTCKALPLEEAMDCEMKKTKQEAEKKTQRGEKMTQEGEKMIQETKKRIQKSEKELQEAIKANQKEKERGKAIDKLCKTYNACN